MEGSLEEGNQRRQHSKNTKVGMCVWQSCTNVCLARRRVEYRGFEEANNTASKQLIRLSASLRGDCVALFFSSCRYRSQTVNIPEAADYGAKQKYLSDSDELPRIIYCTSAQQTISVCEVPQL